MLSLIPMTCSHCLYSGYLSDFLEKGKGDASEKISKKLRKAILDEKLLKPMSPIKKGTPSSSIPAFVKYDLIAQMLKHK